MMSDKAYELRLMMKNLLFLLILLLWLNPEQGRSQISILPEVGVNYMTHKMDELYFIERPNKIQILFGVSAQIPLNDEWYFTNRISYSRRTNMSWQQDVDFVPYLLLNSSYKQNDLNIDLSMNYVVSEYISIFSGPSIIRSFGTETHNYIEDDTAYKDLFYINSFGLGINTGVSYNINRFKIKFYYLRMFRTKMNLLNYYLGMNRFDVTVSYHLFGGDKGKKR